jgi:hypothetical protein
MEGVLFFALGSLFAEYHFGGENVNAMSGEAYTFPLLTFDCTQGTCTSFGVPKERE